MDCTWFILFVGFTVDDKLEYLVHTVSLDKFKNIIETKK